MARIRFLADEHVPSAVTKGLRARGIDALTAAEAGILGTADEPLLAQANVQSRVLITYDADFLRLHAAGIPHAGIVYGPSDTSIGLAIGGALLIADVLDSDAMMNHVEFL